MLSIPVRITGWVLASFAMLALAAVVSAPVADAHEHREVGPYTFVVGWTGEPALVGQPNQVSIRIERAADAGSADQEQVGEMVGVEGLSLEVEVTYLETGDSVVLPLHGAFGDPGHYIAEMIPTLTGVYSFRVFGDVEGQAVDETFEAGPNTFSVINRVDELQFPVTVPEARELQSATEGLQQAVLDAEAVASDADSAASNAQTLSIVALVVGVLGLAAGGAGTVLTLRRR